MFLILKWRDNEWVYYESGVFELSKADLRASNQTLSEIVQLVIQWVSLILSILYIVGAYNLLVISLRYSVIST
jgi:hypothetical protein